MSKNINSHEVTSACLDNHARNHFIGNWKRKQPLASCHRQLRAWGFASKKSPRSGIEPKTSSCRAGECLNHCTTQLHKAWVMRKITFFKFWIIFTCHEKHFLFHCLKKTSNPRVRFPILWAKSLDGITSNSNEHNVMTSWLTNDQS